MHSFRIYNSTGIGFGMALMTGIVAVYYTVIMAWTLFYFGMSFSATLPWSHCDNHWNTDACYMRLSRQDADLSNSSLIHSNQSDSMFTNNINQLDLVIYQSNSTLTNATSNASAIATLLKTPTEEFWE
jgi:hypothetical protein